MHRPLRAALSDSRPTTSVRALLLTGSGRGFCAGQDLSDRNAPATSSCDLGQTWRALQSPGAPDPRADMPVVCAVNGVAAGAGANIALACDIVLAARSAQVHPGLLQDRPGPGQRRHLRLPRLVGEARAKGLALLGTPLSAEQAAAWGLIWRAVDDDDAAWTRRDRWPAPGDPADQRPGAASSRRIQASADNDLDQQLDLERDLQRQAGRSADYREGVAAFLDKRPPQFRAR